MGADISFYDKDGEEVFYFRDSYNDTNLAWIKGLSYWCDGQTHAQQVAFFEQLAALSDAQLAAHVAALCACDPAVEQEQWAWLRMFAEKRDAVRRRLPAIRAATRIVWNV